MFLLYNLICFWRIHLQKNVTELAEELILVLTEFWLIQDYGTFWKTLSMDRKTYLLGLSAGSACMQEIQRLKYLSSRIIKKYLCAFHILSAQFQKETHHSRRFLRISSSSFALISIISVAAFESSPEQRASLKVCGAERFFQRGAEGKSRLPSRR